MDELLPFLGIYLVLFSVAGLGGSSWFLFFLAFESRRERFKVIRLMASIVMPGVLAVSYCAIYFGEQLNVSGTAHKALGTSAAIGIMGLPFWRFTLAVGRVSTAAVEATRDWHIEIRRNPTRGADTDDKTEDNSKS